MKRTVAIKSQQRQPGCCTPRTVNRSAPHQRIGCAGWSLCHHNCSAGA